jgi:hypothetical protein
VRDSAPASTTVRQRTQWRRGRERVVRTRGCGSCSLHDAQIAPSLDATDCSKAEPYTSRLKGCDLTATQPGKDLLGQSLAPSSQTMQAGTVAA